VDVNGPGAEDMGSDLQGITTDGFPIADRHPLASASQRRRGGSTLTPLRLLATPQRAKKMKWGRV